MSDLASPMLYVMEGDEAEAFWCFAALMDRQERCFDEGQSAVQSQLKVLCNVMQVTINHTQHAQIYLDGND
jgi:hypothetical protein